MEVIASSTLVNDIVEEIFLRLPVKSLIRLKTLSKQWRSTIESHSFAKRHLKIAERSDMDHLKLIAVSKGYSEKANSGHLSLDKEIVFATICVESAPLLSLTLPIVPDGFIIYVSESCDGLLCIYSPESIYIYVVNPATRWFRQLPSARIQILMHKLMPDPRPDLLGYHDQSPIYKISVPYLAFVKAADYKLVWFYNSDKYNSDALSPNEGLTKCEVFDFSKNAWRYLTCIPSYKIFHGQTPAYVNGSIYWFTEQSNYDGIKVVAFDIRTETFRLLPNIHPVLATSDPYDIYICTLDNGLCMMRNENKTKLKEFWRLKSSENMWEKIYTVDFRSYSCSWSRIIDAFYWTTVAICMNKKILFSCPSDSNLVEYDPQTNCLFSIFQHPHDSCIRYVPYFQSLISHI